MEWLFGWRLDDLEAAAKQLGRYLGPGESHDSFYLGGSYYLWTRSVEEIRLQHNQELPGELAEPEFPAYPLLVLAMSARPTQPVDDWNAIARTLGLQSLRRV